jgi:hypothetical protein
MEIRSLRLCERDYTAAPAANRGITLRVSANCYNDPAFNEVLGEPEGGGSETGSAEAFLVECAVGLR